MLLRHTVRHRRRFRLTVSTVASVALALPACAAQVPQSVMASTTTIPTPPAQAASTRSLVARQAEPSANTAEAPPGRGDTEPPSTTEAAPQETSAPTTTFPPAPAEVDTVQVAGVALDGIEVVSAQRVESSDAPPYNITTTVPALMHPDEAVSDAVNSAINDAVVAPIELFRSDMEDYFGGLTAADVDPSSFITTFEVTLLSNELLSLRFRFENLIGGSEIPTTQTGTLVFDLATGDVVRLEDVVGADGLQALADLVKSSVIRSLYDGDPEAFAPWAPSIGPDYLGSFSVAQEGLQFSFSRYECRGPTSWGRRLSWSRMRTSSICSIHRRW